MSVKHNTLNQLSDKLKGYSGGNPFREEQARYYTDERLIEEFFPTSSFLSLFNQQNEILLGTRGSGKTALLRMLSYSQLRKIKDKIQDPIVKDAVENKLLLGFYIPLHLEFISSLENKGQKYSSWTEYFMFAFNCLAADSFLSLLTALIDDIYIEGIDKIDAELKVVESLSEMWLKEFSAKNMLIDDLKWKIKLDFNKQAAWEDGNNINPHPLARPILVPIVNVIERISKILNLNNNSYWIACVDEAEFLKEPFIRTINTFLRSKQHPLIVKMATLPYKHSTRETSVEGIYIEANGNDFNYRKVDLDYNALDFENLTNYICKVRLKRSGLQIEKLEDFLGKIGNDEGIDYFRNEMKQIRSEAELRELIEKEIVQSLSFERKARYENIKHDSMKVGNEYIRRFSPVYYVRKMKQEDSKANRKPGWYAGSKVIRQVSDGNPRRFIQLMNDIVQTAINTDLTTKQQHRTITGFCDRVYEASGGLPTFGPITKDLIDNIGKLLHESVHGPVMFDIGSSFKIDPVLLEDETIKSALEQGIAYSYIIVDDTTINIEQINEFRLSFLCSVHFWLPLRHGESRTLKPHAINRNLFNHRIDNITPSVAKKYIDSIQLNLFGEQNE